ncbi:hypothetical protein MNEG_0156 [Monoraphidium neglectum]|uniref:Transmembrane protein n=1 Tax=Monoraphidium neglectum TaxID=145388 RepID=A0A0D2KCI7_9CHLO|nr:hypothetical protein MNEG_0156 [Monoraphidium neglectum]KIZ07798.1 hypothetical protein MNEG_0156 [Monoraphidium neglectum]|eukprot:XP_013906817.1 hypothetical protein MNEG_0156 [Monoraphidium neglectum]
MFSRLQSDLRLDDLAHDHLAAPAPPPEKRTSWRRALLVNSWVLLLAAGVLVITVVSSSRLHVSEPLQHAHAVNGAEPYLLPIAPGPIQYLYVVFVGAPWYGAGSTSSSSYGRRRLSAFEIATSAGAGWASEAPPAAMAPLHPVEAAAHLRRLKSHRVLAAAAVESGEGEASSPAVMITLMQRDPAAAAAGPAAVLSVAALAGAVVKPTQLGLVPVSQPRACRLKPGAASRCLLSFTGGDVDAATYVPGRETFLVFHLEQPGQVAFDIHAKELGGLGPAKNWIALTILLLMLAGIASERVHRM